MPTYVFKGRNRLNEIVVGERVADNRERCVKSCDVNKSRLLPSRKRVARSVSQKLAAARK